MSGKTVQTEEIQELEAIEKRIEQLDEEQFRVFRAWLVKHASSRSSADQPRSFVDLQGTIKVGPGSVSEDIRKAREMYGK